MYKENLHDLYSTSNVSLLGQLKMVGERSRACSTYGTEKSMWTLVGKPEGTFEKKT